VYILTIPATESMHMPARKTTPKMQRRAAELRHIPTEAEARLWAHLRAHRMQGIHFRRQHAIGSYIVDFCALHPKLVIELDGSQHLDQAEYDRQREATLVSKGFRVLRFWNNEVMNDLDGVYQAIETAIVEAGIS
jgi:very-short-patch-repair endonuclease